MTRHRYTSSLPASFLQPQEEQQKKKTSLNFCGKSYNIEDQYTSYFTKTHGVSQLFGVAAGHGLYQHEVVNFIKQRLPSLLFEDPSFQWDRQLAITTAIASLSSELTSCDFDVNFSGWSLWVILLEGDMMWIANIGDCQAMLGRSMSSSAAGMSGKESWMTMKLSRQHKLTFADETQRIINHGGIISSSGTPRIWMDQGVPGLCVTRSIGDLIAGSVGVAAEPELLTVHMKPSDRFIIMGTAQIFQIFNTKQLMEQVVPFWKTGEIKQATDLLLKETKARSQTGVSCLVIFR